MYSTSHQTKNSFDSKRSAIFFVDLYPSSVGASADKATTKFLQEVLQVLLDFIRSSNDRDSKILDFHQPDQITGMMDFSLPDEPQSLGRVLSDCRDALKYQVKTGKRTISSLIKIIPD